MKISKNKKKKMIILIFLIILITVMVFLFSSISNRNDKNDNIQLQSGDTNQEFNNTQKESKNIAILGVRNMVIEANKKNVSANFQNPIENEGLYYQSFELRLLNNSEEGYEVLYKSDLVSPGEEITNIELSRELEKGEYEAILYVQPYFMDAEKTPTNDAKIKMKVIAK